MFVVVTKVLAIACYYGSTNVRLARLLRDCYAEGYEVNHL